MPFLLIDETFPENPKIDELSDAAFRLHVTALCYAARNLTDGHITKSALKRCTKGARTSARRAHELTQSGCWEVHPDGDEHGWIIHDYLDWNRSRENILEQRKANAERQRRWREKHTAQPNPDPPSNAVSNAVSNAAQPNPTQPKEELSPSGDSSRAPQLAAASHLTPANPGKQQPQQQTGFGPQVIDTEALNLIHDTLDTRGYAQRDILALAAQAQRLATDGTPPTDIAAALRIWATKPHLGPRALPCCLTEHAKTTHAPGSPDWWNHLKNQLNEEPA